MLVKVPLKKVFRSHWSLSSKIKNKKGINGIHLMTLGWEEVVGRIVTESGFIPPEAPQPPEGAGFNAGADLKSVPKI